MVKSEIRKVIEDGKTSLGIELGSTRIKAILIDDNNQMIAQGSYQWENRYENKIWTYSLDDIHTGIQGCYRNLKDTVKNEYDITMKTVGSMGISAMMHGYMVFDKNRELLVPFRTWRNTMTEKASQILTEKFQYPIPQRWSIAHLYQAILNGEEHVDKISYLITLDGYVHWKLTGEKVIGIGQASGMFPINDHTRDFDDRMMDTFMELIKEKHYPWEIREIMPRVLNAGEHAGYLTEEGARFLDPSGDLEAGIPMCPPEGDAGTGMVATNSVKKGTGNVSAGTSVFAMIVLDKPLSRVYSELDMVTTPDGEQVAMVHCNNCTSELDSWIRIFREVLREFDVDVDDNILFAKLYEKALEGESDGGNLMSYAYLSGEHITGVEQGCPMFFRRPDSHFCLANFMRTQLYSAIGTLRIGMDFLIQNEHVKIEHLMGHGGYFKTPGVGQKMMADVLGIPIFVMKTAGEGGAWGMALLASYMKNGEGEGLPEFLQEKVFCNSKIEKVNPDEKDKKGADRFIEVYKKGLQIEKMVNNYM